MKREPLEIERLIRDDQRHSTPERRRVSVAEHEQFQKHLAASLADQQPVDEIDASLEADPIHDHLPGYQSKKKTARVLGILDQLNKEGRK
jgi:hypothetical protein